MGERDAALAALDNAIAIDPDYATAHYNRGMLLVEMRRPDEARDSFRKVLAARQDSADAWHNVGAAHLSLKEYEPAVAACRQAHKGWRGIRNPDDRSFHPQDSCWARAAAIA